MTNADIQMLLLAAGYYKGGIDGIIGKQSLAAINKIIERHLNELAVGGKWTDARRKIAAAQLVLRYAGYAPGAIDGYVGPNTTDALRLWRYKTVSGADEVIPQNPVPGYKPPTDAVSVSFPKQSNCNTYYGNPAKGEVAPKLKLYTLPVAMRIDWDLSTKVTRVQLHEKCGASAMAAQEAIVRHYGETDWRKLSLDRHAGTYNHRKMRGGTSWSMHAYGCAWDFYAAPNGLTTRCPNALFCKDEYKAFFDIWESFGWVSLGRAIGRDWMHVQAARL